MCRNDVSNMLAAWSWKLQYKSNGFDARAPVSSCAVAAIVAKKS